MTPLFKGMRLGAKVSLLGAGSVLAAAIALVLLAVWQSGRYQALARSEVDGLINADLDHIAQGVYNLVRTEDEAAQQQVNSHLGIARYILNAAGGVSLSRETTTWEAIDQHGGRRLTLRLPKMLVGGRWLGRNADPATRTAVVDEVTGAVGGDATIFQRMNERGDMLRVATTVRTPEGQRGVGTFIPATNPDGTPNPVIAAVMRGDTYRGRAMVLDQWHLTAYEPLRDGAGNLVGLLYVGLELRTIAARVRQAILSTRVGRTGYVYALGGTGGTRGRYLISQNGERDGEDIWDSRDSDGRPVVQAIINRALALQPGELATERYRWQNPGEPAPRWKVARLAYYAPWDWVLGVSVYEDELQGYRAILSEGRARMTGVLALAGLAITLLVGLAGAFVAMSLTRPIRKLTSAAESMTRGAPGGPVGIHSRDEIGTLAGAFDHMTEQLGKTVENLRRSEESYRQIVDTANEGIMVVDGEQHLTLANARLAELLGRPVEALIGRDIGAFMFEEDLPDQDRRLANRRTGVAEQYERRFRRPDGSAVWTIVSATPLPPEGGEYRGSFAMLTDITERRQAEERLAALIRIKERVFAATTLEERLKLVTDGAVGTMGADFARIWMVGPGDLCGRGCPHAAVTEGPHVCRDRSHCLHLMASSGRYPRTDGSHRRVPVGAYKIGRIASGDEARFITNDVTHDPRVHNRQWAHELGLVAFAGYRLVSAEGVPIGVFALFSRREIDAGENTLLEDLANTASLAIRAGLAEDAVRLSERRYRTLFETANDAIFVMEGNTFVDCNSRALEMFGCRARSDLLDHTPLDFSPPTQPDGRPSREGAEEHIRATLAGATRSFAWRHLRRDGTPFDVEVSLSRLELGDRRLVQAICRDITGRRQAEEALRQAHENLLRTLRFNEAVLTAIPTPVFYKDREGRYLGCNLAFTEIMGVTAEEMRGKTVDQLWPGEHARVYHQKDLELMSHPARQIYEFRVRDKDGRDRPVIYSKDVFRDEKDRVAGIIGAFLDITARKEAEEEVRQLNAELEQRVAQRTIQLEAANQELEAFSYSVSHDLRAPLRAIDGFSQALLDDHADQLDEEGRQYLRRVRAGSARMAELIDDLLKLSRVTRSEMRRVEVDLSALAGTLAAELRAGRPERRVEFVIAPGLTARADPAMMRILLQNLLGNAWKFTAHHPAARIEVGTVDRDGRTAFFVRDDGAGFDMAYSGRLFGAFQRAHSLTEFEGTGIGLATVRRIVRRHGGDTWAEGAVEQGATIYFTLPE